MHKVRKLILLAAALALFLPAAAPAKLQGALRVCGTSGCRIIGRHAGHDIWPLVADLTAGRASGPARPAAFYVLTIVDSEGRAQPSSPSAPAYYVPASGRIRTNATVEMSDGLWRILAVPPPALAAAVRTLRPFPAPLLVRVDVDGRVATNPQSYLRLFRIPRSGRQISDPAGSYPTELDDRGFANTEAIVRYWQRVHGHWLPVTPSSRRPSPWGDADTSLWVGRRLDLVKRDGEIVRVSHALAARIRRADSLRF